MCHNAPHEPTYGNEVLTDWGNLHYSDGLTIIELNGKCAMSYKHFLEKHQALHGICALWVKQIQ